MALAIISELDLAAADAARIEDLRRRHDPQQSMVAAHFTLVFPFEGLDRAVVEAHAERIARQTEPIAFHLRRSAAVQDPLGPLSRLFLLPEAGNDQLIALHDALYAGPLSAHLRGDIAYRPHITVGAFPTQDLARVAQAEVGVVDLAGTVSAFDLVAFDGRTVSRLRRFALG
jgi:2'-5' RNA ligase